MIKPSRVPFFLRLVLLALLGLPLASIPASAQPVASTRAVAITRPPAAPYAVSFSMKRWFSGGVGRSRVIQIGTVVMCLALFILMRKLH
jgi:hypothetical protein